MAGGIAGCNWSSSSSPPPRDGGIPYLDSAIPSFDSGVPVDSGDVVDSGPSTDAAIDAACTPASAPVMHTTDVTSSETWASGIHVVPSSIQVKNGAQLSIAPCSEIRLGSGASIAVASAGSALAAVGTAAGPIRFVSAQSGARWGDIDVRAPATAHLAYVTLTGGGAGPHDTSPFAGASLAAIGSPAMRPVVLRTEHVVVTGSGGLGAMLVGARFDPASTDLTITGSGWYPIYLGVASANELPDGTYTGNAIDQILLQTYDIAAYDDSGPLVSDVALRNLGVPYRVGTVPTQIKIGDLLPTSPKASLTIAAGVTLLFTPQGTGAESGIVINAQAGTPSYQPQGALVVQGTAAAPVVLDSAAAAPAPGDWQGLYFDHVVDSRTSITYARILHAGGASGAVGICGSTPTAPNGVATCAIVMQLDDPPAAFLSNSVVEAAPCGVYRGWNTTDVDFVSTNQFVTIPGCTETSVPQTTSPACAACPTSP